jgi:hypothetical protein
MKRLVVIALAALSFGSLARADIWCSGTKHPGDVQLWSSQTGSFRTGNQLWEECSAPDSDDFRNGTCAGYIVGVTDVMQSQKSANSICIPDGVNIKQLVDVVKKFLSDHPEMRQQPADWQVTSALSVAFVCKSASQPAQ